MRATAEETKRYLWCPMATSTTTIDSVSGFLKGRGIMHVNSAEIVQRVAQVMKAACQILHEIQCSQPWHELCALKDRTDLRTFRLNFIEQRKERFRCFQFGKGNRRTRTKHGCLFGSFSDGLVQVSKPITHGFDWSLLLFSSHQNHVHKKKVGYDEVQIAYFAKTIFVDSAAMHCHSATFVSCFSKTCSVLSHSRLITCQTCIFRIFLQWWSCISCNNMLKKTFYYSCWLPFHAQTNSISLVQNIGYVYWTRLALASKCLDSKYSEEQSAAKATCQRVFGRRTRFCFATTHVMISPERQDQGSRLCLPTKKERVKTYSHTDTKTQRRNSICRKQHFELHTLKSKNQSWRDKQFVRFYSFHVSQSSRFATMASPSVSPSPLRRLPHQSATRFQRLLQQLNECHEEDRKFDALWNFVRTYWRSHKLVCKVRHIEDARLQELSRRAPQTLQGIEDATWHKRPWTHFETCHLRWEISVQINCWNEVCDMFRHSLSCDPRSTQGSCPQCNFSFQCFGQFDCCLRSYQTIVFV